MLKVLVILAVCAISSIHGSDVPCPCGWQKIRNGCYKFVNDKVTWDAARADCQKRGGDLALPLSRSECQQLAQEAHKAGLGASWIGVFRRRDDKMFMTTCGEKLAVSCWNTGEPTDNDDNENCVGMYTEGIPLGLWNDIRCDVNSGYICEIKLPRCK